MASTQQIRRRIRSVKNTRQITKAMELVAASKMRRAQEATLRSRAYRNTAREILSRLKKLTDVSASPLYKIRPVKSRLLIALTSDRGLAGAYNSNVLRLLASELRADQSAGIQSHVIVIGRKGERFVSRVENVSLLGVFEDFPDQPVENDLLPILDQALTLFMAGRVDEVDILYTDFKSSISQEPIVQTILPASVNDVDEPTGLEEAEFEPSPQVVLATITPRLIQVQLLQAILEAKASEHSMRMMAMKNATDNASELIDDLTLEFNSARQAAITQELAEITGGAEAIK